MYSDKHVSSKMGSLQSCGGLAVPLQLSGRQRWIFQGLRSPPMPIAALSS